MAIYYASKAFVLSFSEALWKEAEGTGVHVSCLCPGPTASNFRERAGTGKTRLSRNGAADELRPVVASMGYRAFQKNRRVMITGMRNALLATLAPFLPRRTLLGDRPQSPEPGMTTDQDRRIRHHRARRRHRDRHDGSRRRAQSRCRGSSSSR